MGSLGASGEKDLSRGVLFRLFWGTLALPGSPLALTWLHFGPLWAPRAPIWETFGSHLAPLGRLGEISENIEKHLVFSMHLPKGRDLGALFFEKQYKKNYILQP